MVKKVLNKIFNYILKNKNISDKAKIGKYVNIGELTFIDDNVEIGDYTYIGRNCNITKAKIGRYCSIANNVSIGQGEHILNKISTNAVFYYNAYDELTKKECIIENDVWIGTDAIILRGVHVGNGAVIGANAVVTKDVPDFAIVAGVPAKILRYRFDEKKRKKILESKWWKKDKRGAEEIIKRLEKQ